MPAKRKKATGLAAFTKHQTAPESAHEADIRTKAKKETVAVTLRLTRDQWERVHQLARAEGVSLNQLALHGLSKLLEDRGLASL